MVLREFRIAVVGAGPAGLTLGVLLQKHGIPFTMFELRQQPTEEALAKPAGSLDLHEEDGLAALKECDLLDEFASFTGDCTEAQKIADKSGKVIYADEGEESNRPEISRHKLIKLLLKHLPTSSIKWGHKLLSVTTSTASGHEEVELDFGKDGKYTFDLVIGADGAWSRIRSMLTGEKPRYAGLQNITLNIRQVTKLYPQLAELIGSGTFTALADKSGVFSQRSVDDSARIYIMVSTDDEHYATTHGLSGKTPVEAKERLLSADLPFHRWGANLKELVAVACEDESADNPGVPLDVKALYTLPVGHTWKHHSGATLVGDAAHLNNPPAGEGVNIAMNDSLLLSRAIVKAYASAGQDITALRSTLDTLIQEFEAEMVPRAIEMAHGSREVSEMMFGGDNGSKTMADWFEGFRIQPA